MEGLEDDIDIIKSLIAIAKGGLPLDNIQKEYRSMTEEALNPRKYGFGSVREMLLSSKDIVIRESSTGPVCHVIDEKMSHVTELVAKARNSQKKKKKNFQRGRSFPASSRNWHSPFRSSPSTQRKSHHFSKGSSMPSQFKRYSQPMNRSQSPHLPYRNASQTTMDGNRRTASQPDSVNDKYSRKEVTHSKSHPRPQHQSNYSQQSRFSAQPSQKSSFETGKYCEGSGSNLKQKDQMPYEHKSSTQLSRSKSESDWSDSAEGNASSGWSTEPQSNFECDKKCTNGAAASMEKTSRTVEYIPSRSSNGPKYSLNQGSSNHTSSLTVTVPRPQDNRCSSGSDWSDSDEPSYVCKPHGDPPTSRSMSMLTPRISLPLVSNTSSPGSISYNSLQEKELCRPLMVGGIGRGKCLLNSLQYPQSIVVKVTPTKREATFSYKPSRSPSYRGHQLIGDMYMSRVAQICSRNSVDVQGLCKENLTLSECEEEIIKYGVSAKLVIMIGMTDILKGATFENMKSRMSSLLQRLKREKIILITLPVPPSFIYSVSEMKLAVLEKYNKWLLKLDLPCIIDIDTHLYCNPPFFQKYQGSLVETFSKEGSEEVIAAIDSVLD